jgi:integrase
MSGVVVLDQPAGEITSEDLEDLARMADGYAARSYAANTKRPYLGAWLRFVEWCRSAGMDATAASNDTVALYLTARAADLSTTSIEVELAGIRAAYRLAGLTLDGDGTRLSLVLDGIQRSKGRQRGRAAAPAVPDVLRRLLATRQPPSRPAGARDRAMLLIGFGAALRRAELVGLKIGDVQRDRDHGLVVSVRRSKTDQYGEGVDIPVCGNQADPEFCPAIAFDRWMFHRRVGPDGEEPGAPLFCGVNKAERLSGRPLCDVTVNRLLKEAAAAAGLPEGDYSGHSLRRGLATAAAQAGVGLPDLMRHTRHRSPRVALTYIEEANRWDNASGAIFGGRR